MPTNSYIFIGDLVEVTLVGEKWGVGIVENISTNSHGGSLLFPAFLVRKDNEEIWVPPISMEKIERAEDGISE